MNMLSAQNSLFSSGSNSVSQCATQSKIATAVYREALLILKGFFFFFFPLLARGKYDFAKRMIPLCSLKG